MKAMRDEKGDMLPNAHILGWGLPKVTFFHNIGGQNSPAMECGHTPHAR